MNGITISKNIKRVLDTWKKRGHTYFIAGRAGKRQKQRLKTLEDVWGMLNFLMISHSYQLSLGEVLEKF